MKINSILALTSLISDRSDQKINKLIKIQQLIHDKQADMATYFIYSFLQLISLNFAQIMLTQSITSTSVAVTVLEDTRQELAGAPASMAEPLSTIVLLFVSTFKSFSCLAFISNVTR